VLIRGGASESLVRNSLRKAGRWHPRGRRRPRCNLFSQNIITSNAGKGIALAGETTKSPRRLSRTFPQPATRFRSYQSRASAGTGSRSMPTGRRRRATAGISPVIWHNFSINSPVPLQGRFLPCLPRWQHSDSAGDQDNCPTESIFYSHGEPGARNLLALDPDWPLAQTIVAGAARFRSAGLCLRQGWFFGLTAKAINPVLSGSSSGPQCELPSIPP
jgi:hypothetical protein